MIPTPTSTQISVARHTFELQSCGTTSISHPLVFTEYELFRWRRYCGYDVYIDTSTTMTMDRRWSKTVVWKDFQRRSISRLTCNDGTGRSACYDSDGFIVPYLHGFGWAQRSRVGSNIPG